MARLVIKLAQNTIKKQQNAHKKQNKTSRQSTLATLGLWKNWCRSLASYEQDLRDQPEKLAKYRKLVWQQEKKWTYVSMNAEERTHTNKHGRHLSAMT